MEVQQPQVQPEPTSPIPPVPNTVPKVESKEPTQKNTTNGLASASAINPKKTIKYIVIAVVVLIIVAVSFFAYTQYLVKSSGRNPVPATETSGDVVVEPATGDDEITNDITSLETDVVSLDGELNQLEEDLNFDIDFTL